MLGDVGEHVGEPSLRLDIIELGGLDQRVKHGGAVAAAVGAAEQPGFAGRRSFTTRCSYRHSHERKCHGKLRFQGKRRRNPALCGMGLA